MYISKNTCKDKRSLFGGGPCCRTSCEIFEPDLYGSVYMVERVLGPCQMIRIYPGVRII